MSNVWYILLLLYKDTVFRLGWGGGKGRELYLNNNKIRKNIKKILYLSFYW